MNFGPVSYQSNANELGAAILRYAEVYTKKELPEILVDQAARLSCSDFGPNNRGLFQESADTAPTEEALLALPATKAYHIKHSGRLLFTTGYELQTYKRGARKGKFRVNRRGQIIHKLIGREGEMNRRARHAKFQAAGWLSARLGKYASGAATAVGQKPDRAVIELVLTGDVLSVAITNTSPAALEVAERTGYMVRALTNRKSDLDTYTVRKWAELVEQFNALKPPPPR